jgi:Major Facilitator Superfamily
MALISDLPDVAVRARRRVAFRILPFIFLLYIINYLDRVNVSFANLRMSADLGFSDRVYGIGVGMFYVSYVLFEIPGAILVERWSASKWIARIMISWGSITILTGFVHSAGQFYAVRFLLGVAEASFLPGMIVYLTHWFSVHDRSRALACLLAAIPTASLIGSPLAGWLLVVHWWSLTGWRWLFIVEGIPALVFGIVTLYYMTDWPSQARWLPDCEREWLVNQLQAELQVKKNTRDVPGAKVLRLWAEKGFPMPEANFQYHSPAKPIPYEDVDLAQPCEAFNIVHELTTKGLDKFVADYQKNHRRVGERPLAGSPTSASPLLQGFEALVSRSDFLCQYRRCLFIELMLVRLLCAV